jgi:hypothetical protein
VTQWGLLFAVGAIVARAYVLMPLSFVAARQLSGIDVPRLLYSYLPVICSTAVMALAVEAWRHLAASILRADVLLATSVLLGIAVYGGMVWLLARPVVSEMVELVRGGFLPRSPRSVDGKLVGR